MGEVLDISLSFPTVVFTACLAVVFVYWLVVLIGAVDLDILDADGGEAGVAGALLPTTRAGRDVPITIVVSLWILLSWLASGVLVLVAADLGLSAALPTLLSLLVLVLAPVAAWMLTVLAMLPLARLYRTDDAASHHDFVGKTCVIRTTGVSADFGQAEITSTDGSSAIVQVRLGDGLDDPPRLERGATALIFDYDPGGGHFYVTPFDSSFGSRPDGNP